MICPHCNKNLKLAPNNAFMNAEIYGNPNKVITLCCNKMVVISRRIMFDITASNSTEKDDDWGNSIKN